MLIDRRAYHKNNHILLTNFLYIRRCKQTFTTATAQYRFCSFLKKRQFMRIYFINRILIDVNQSAPAAVICQD